MVCVVCVCGVCVVCALPSLSPVAALPEALFSLLTRHVTSPPPVPTAHTHTHTAIAQAGVAAGSEPKDCVIKPSVFKSTLQEVGKQMELPSTEINKLMHMMSHDRHAFLNPAPRDTSTLYATPLCHSPDLTPPPRTVPSAAALAK